MAFTWGLKEKERLPIGGGEMGRPRYFSREWCLWHTSMYAGNLASGTKLALEM